MKVDVTKWSWTRASTTFLVFSIVCVVALLALFGVAVDHWRHHNGSDYPWESYRNSFIWWIVFAFTSGATIFFAIGTLYAAGCIEISDALAYILPFVTVNDQYLIFSGHYLPLKSLKRCASMALFAIFCLFFSMGLTATVTLAVVDVLIPDKFISDLAQEGSCPDGFDCFDFNRHDHKINCSLAPFHDPLYHVSVQCYQFSETDLGIIVAAGGLAFSIYKFLIGLFKFSTQFLYVISLGIGWAFGRISPCCRGHSHRVVVCFVPPAIFVGLLVPAIFFAIDLHREGKLDLLEIVQFSVALLFLLLSVIVTIALVFLSEPKDPMRQPIMSQGSKQEPKQDLKQESKQESQ